jgi:protein-S-isoprenylcysteine O-methyltransferase Ste14
MFYFLLLVSPVLALFLTYLGIKTLPDNLLGWFLVLIGLGYLTGGMIYAWRNRGKVSVIREERGDRSFWLILPGFLAIFFSAPLEFLYGPGVLPRAPGMQIAGSALIVAALALRIWARRIIRGMYTGHVQIRTDHRLVQGGPYRYVRHPGYVGFLLMGLGIAIGYSSLIGLGSIPLLLFPGLVYRMRVEEKLLEQQFGEKYRHYASKTGRWFPRLW